MKTRSVIQPSTVDLSLAIVEHDSKNPEIFKAVQVALTAIAVLINEIASYGAILPNLSGLTTGYVCVTDIPIFIPDKEQHAAGHGSQQLIFHSAYYSRILLICYPPGLIEEIEAMHEGGKDWNNNQIETRRTVHTA